MLGRVTDERGTPLVGVWVTADEVETETNADGRYVLVLDASADRVNYYLPRFGLRTERIAVVLGGDVRQDVRLARGGGVVGRVLDSAGVPVTGAKITCTSHTSRADGVTMTGVTDAAGRFSLAEVTGPAFRVDIVASGFAPVVRDDVPADTDLGDVVLEPR